VGDFDRRRDKNPRFGAIEGGTASAEHAAADVVLFVGDNIQDFPERPTSETFEE